MRQGKWKAVSANRGKTWELYDMQAERTELNDLAKTQPERAAALAKLWHQWATPHTRGATSGRGFMVDWRWTATGEASGDGD